MPLSSDRIESILFLSVDIAGSTQLKHQYDIAALQKAVDKNRRFLERIVQSGALQGEITDADELCLKNTFEFSQETYDWIEIITSHLVDFDQDFRRRLKQEGLPDGEDSSIWKCLGDEVIYNFPVSTAEEARRFCRVFLSTLHDFNQKDFLPSGLDKKPHVLRVKGTGWLANFPLRNRRTKLFNKDDFFGLDMDIGFRIAKFTLPGVLCVNVELAHLFAHEADGGMPPFKGGIVGWEELKGMGRGIKYPIIWLADPSCSAATLEQAFTQWQREEDEKIRAFYHILGSEHATLCSVELETALGDLRMTLDMPEPAIVSAENPPKEMVKLLRLMQHVCKGAAGSQDPPPLDAPQQEEKTEDTVSFWKNKRERPTS